MLAVLGEFMRAAAPASLRSYLAGLVLQRAYASFEAELNPFVKAGMSAHFHAGAQDAEYDAWRDGQTQTHRDKCAALQARVEELEAGAARLRAQAVGSDRSGKLLKQAHNQEKKVAKARQQQAAARPPTLMPLWVWKSRQGLGRSLKPFVNDDGKLWDTYTLVSVMRAHLREVFAPQLAEGGELEAKGLCGSLLRTVEGRTRRAHNEMPTEAEALEALRCMCEVLELCGRPHRPMRRELHAARALVDRARLSARGAAAGAARHCTVRRSERRAMQLYLAMMEFEALLEREAGSFAFADGTITFGARASGWPEARCERLRAVAGDLAQVAQARHCPHPRSPPMRSPTISAITFCTPSP